MPVPFHTPRPVQVDVHPILSSSTPVDSRLNDLGQASSGLWKALLHRRSGGNSHKDNISEENERIAIAVVFSEDRRLDDQSKSRNVVVWIKRSHKDAPVYNGTSSKDYNLFLPPNLIPPWSTSPLRALVHIHNPVHLTLAILQPVLEDGSVSNISAAEDLDLAPLYSDGDHFNVHLPNGHSHPQSEALTPIIREGSTLAITTKTSDSIQRQKVSFRVLMIEPVRQGILTPSTRVIISTKPYILPKPAINGYQVDDDYPAEGSSHGGKTHLSLADFDPDAFLSSSLSLAISSPPALPEGSPTLETIDLSHSISSETSGSITPRPYNHAVNGDGIPPSPPAPIDEIFAEAEERGGTRFSAVVTAGNTSDDASSEEVWIGMGGLGRAGIFEGDWVLLKPSTSAAGQTGRLVKVKVWERLDETIDYLPINPLLISPTLSRSLFPDFKHSSTPEVVQLYPTPFGARVPTIPIARTITLSRIATTEGVDKRYERSWLKGLKSHFTGDRKGKRRADDDSDTKKLVKRGDIISVPVWRGTPVSEIVGEDDSDESTGMSEDSDDEMNIPLRQQKERPTAVVYFIVTGLSYEPLLELEEDFSSTIPSKARSGELGCWVDVGEDGSTKMILAGVERMVVASRRNDVRWHGMRLIPAPYSSVAITKLRDLLAACFSFAAMTWSIHLSVLVKGARGSGKTSLIRSLAEDLGFNVVEVECFDIVGDTAVITEGSIKAQLEKAKSCAPSILLLNHVEALAKKSESTTSGKPPSVLKVLNDVLAYLKTGAVETGWPMVFMGTTADEDSIPSEILGCFKQEISLSAPNENERQIITRNALHGISTSPDVNLKTIATQTAALQAGDIVNLILQAQDNALKRCIESSGRSLFELKAAGISITAADIDSALAEARSSYSDSIGAPKIPNVSWDDVGGLANVKADILDTIQLPLEHPELFADGLKKRSGILLYGPPGTGKTLLAKAVATTLSLNFFSVKGPELLNMYIGESEANVRRVFQRARDASPCVIFMDELDSIAPKRGNQGDSGGVMDRIVSQLLAELDGMSDNSSNGGEVYVMAATNRPDLLDSALLRPGRFDRMLYLGVASTHQDQLNILQALTRKFKLHPNLSLEDIAEQCPFNYTGADLYALCSDAMLKAMTRKAEAIDNTILKLNTEVEEGGKGKRDWPYPLTPQYYLSTMASQEEIEVLVEKEDFEMALKGLVASVSEREMEHYKRVQEEFKGFNIGQ